MPISAVHIEAEQIFVRKYSETSLWLDVKLTKFNVSWVSKTILWIIWRKSLKFSTTKSRCLSSFKEGFVLFDNIKTYFLTNNFIAFPATTTSLIIFHFWSLDMAIKMFTKCHATSETDVSLQNATCGRSEEITNSQTNLKSWLKSWGMKIYVVFDFYYFSCAIYIERI